MIPKKVWLLGFLVAALPACSLGSASPPRSGPAPAPGFPGSKVLAVWLERPYQPPDGPTRLVVYDAEGHINVLPIPLVGSSNAGYVSRIRLSPDGTKVAAVMAEAAGSPPAPSEDVHVIDLTSGATVATLPGGNNGIAWSPDSTRLVVATLGRRPSPSPDAQVVSLSGEVLARLTSGFDPEWAPSADISLSAYDAGNKVAVFDPEGRRLPDDASPEPKPSPNCPGTVSPDGRSAVEVASGPPGIGNESNSFLEACDVATGHKRPLSPGYVPIDLETGNGWLPNGAFATLIGDAFVTIDVATGHKHVLAHAPRTSVYNTLVVVP